MKTAVTVMQGTGHISPMFDACRLVMVVRCCRGEVSAPESHDFPEGFPEKAGLLQDLGVGTLICGAISNEDAAELERRGIRVCSFASGPWREVWQEWRCHRRLSGLHMLPGCRCRRRSRLRRSEGVGGPLDPSVRDQGKDAS